MPTDPASQPSDQSSIPLPSPASPRASLLRVFQVLILSLLAFAGSLACFSCSAYAGLEDYVAELDRDPQTGIIEGAGPISLAPDTPDQPTSACLLLHGFVGSPGDFNQLPYALVDAGYYVHAPLEAGHATDPRDFARQTPDSMYAKTHDEYLALAARFDEVNVIGFSMGGALGTLLAANEPVDNLILAAPYYSITHKFYYGLRVETWNALFSWAIPYVPKTEQFIKVNRKEARDDIFSYNYIPTRGVTTLIALGRKARQLEVLDRIDCPTLFVISKGDEAASPAAAHRVFEQLDAPKQFHWLPPRNNHHLFWDYDRDEAVATILDFLAEN